MEFDKNKILTVVTADQAKVESMGYFSNYVPTMEGYVTGHIKPDKLIRVGLNAIYPFVDGHHNYYSLFYPAPEPTYRPFNNNELNDLVGEVLTNKQSGRRKVVTGKPRESEGVNLDGSYITAKDLLASFYRNGNEPCGVKEQA